MSHFKPDKAKLIARIVAELERELEALERSARSAHEAATHEESRAEDKYDTRGLEASYLAEAQAGRAAEIRRLILMYRHLSPREFGAKDRIGPGAFVELELDGNPQRIFLVAEGGGITAELDGARVQVITPAAPLGEALMGKLAGDLVEIEAKGGVREYEIRWVR